MSHKKSYEALGTRNQLDHLAWESIKETGLTDGELGMELTPEDIGVAQMRNLVKAKEENLKHESARKFEH